MNKLTNLYVVDSTGYDNYGNPNPVKKRFSGGSTVLITHTYSDIVASDKWLLGRPTATTVNYLKTGSATITRSCVRAFNSNNNHLMKETWHGGTNNQITHRYEYYGYGSLYKQIDSIRTPAWSTTQVTHTSDRTRIRTVTDHMSHVTTNSYDIYGRLQTVQDYLGNVTTYGYDELGRQNSVESSLGPKFNQSFNWENPTLAPKARFSLLFTKNDGSQAKELYDKLGRKVRSDVKGFDGSWIYTLTKYNIKGQPDSVSYPYYSGTPLWNRMLYDTYGRQINLYTPSGRNSTWSYNRSTITETVAGKTYSKTYNSDGTIASVTDPGGTLQYSWYPDGSLKTVTAPGNIVTSMEYDIAGNQTQLIDPSAGTLTYTYNGFGQLTNQQTARGETVQINYYSDGRPSSKNVSSEGTTIYSYNTNEQIVNISSPGGIIRGITYYPDGRVNTMTETIPGSSPFTTKMTYDVKGRDSTLTHPSGIVEKNTYNAYGYLSSISAGGVTRWTVTGRNALQQITTGRYGSNLNTTLYYNPHGILTSVQTGSIRLYAYNINDITGNLMFRINVLRNVSESFDYDYLDRLDRVYSGITTKIDMSYDATKGGIVLKSDAGTFKYDNSSKPYALSSIDPSCGLITESMNDTVTYTSFEKVRTIAEGLFSATFLYNANDQRSRMVVMNGNNQELTRWYPTARFMKDSVDGTVKKYTYIGGDAYTAPVVAVSTNDGTPVYYYLLRDHLGSITHVVNSSNTVVAEYSYDAWGRMRNPSTWEVYAPGQEPIPMIGGRGYTCHEHLTWFKLINMNGRLYDPLVGQFLSADKYIQNPMFTQSFNRYGYCLNNPLKYTDPSGEKWNWWKLANFLTGLPISNSIVSDNTATGTSFMMPITDLFTGGMASLTVGTTAITASAMAATFLTTSAITYMAANTTLHSMILPIQQSVMISDYTMGAFYNATHAGDVPDRLGNAFKIDVGYLFSIPGWEDTQSLMGNTFSHIRNLTGNVDNVELDWDRMTILVNDDNPRSLTEWGMTLGPYINGQNMELNDDMYKHEAGHTIQSRILGPFYTQNVGLASIISVMFGSDYHEDCWYEVWASRLGGAPNHVKKYRNSSFWYWFPAYVLPFFPN